MEVLNSNSVRGKLAILAATVGTFASLPGLPAAYADPEPATPNVAPQVDNQNKSPEKLGKAQISYQVGRERRTIQISGTDAHFAEPQFPFATRGKSGTDQFQCGESRDIVIEVERDGPLTHVTFEILLGLPGDKSTLDSLVRDTVALATGDIADLFRPVHDWPVLVAAAQLFDDHTGKTYGEPKLEIVRGLDRLRVKIALDEAELKELGATLDRKHLNHDPRTGSRESSVAWAEVDQVATGILIREIHAAVRSRQTGSQDLLSMNDVTAIVNEVNQNIVTSIRTNEGSVLKALNGLVFDPNTAMRQLFQVDSSALEGLTAQEREAFLEIVGPKQETTHSGLLRRTDQSESTTVEGEVNGKIGNKAKGSISGSLGGQKRSVKGESEVQTQERSGASLVGDLKVFRFNASRAAATFENKLRIEILTARGDLQAWPTVSQALRETLFVPQLQAEAARVRKEVEARMPQTQVTNLYASVIGQRSRIERGSQNVSRGSTSQYGIDKGLHITGRFDPPAGYTLDSFDLHFFKTLGERDTKGSYSRDGNGINYEFDLKHGPWHDRWRHEGGIRGTISYSKEVKDSVHQPIAVPSTLKLFPGQSAKIMDVSPDLLAGVESARVALTFSIHEGSSPEGLIKVDLAPGESKTVDGYQVSFIGNGIHVLQVKNIKLVSK